VAVEGDGDDGEMGGGGRQALQAQHLADHRSALKVQHARLQAVHGGYAGGDKGIQRVSVVCSGRWATRLVADDQKVGLDCNRFRLLFASALSNWGDSAEAARGVQTDRDVVPAALNHADATAIAEGLATENGDPVVHLVAVEHNDGDVGGAGGGRGGRRRCHGSQTAEMFYCKSCTSYMQKSATGTMMHRSRRHDAPAHRAL
jgi:hypothetical protein